MNQTEIGYLETIFQTGIQDIVAYSRRNSSQLVATVAWILELAFPIVLKMKRKWNVKFVNYSIFSFKHILLNLFDFLITDDFAPLVNVICSWEQDTTSNHFTHDATNRPDVYVFLVPHAKNHLKLDSRIKL